MTMTQSLHIGLLGCGTIAQFAHLPAFARAKKVKLVAACDAADDLLQVVAGRFARAKLYTEFDQMLRDSAIQAVLIAVPDALHVPLTLRALEAGKHVLVEKPLGITSAECTRVVRAQRELGLRVQVGSMKRHDPSVAFARQFAREKLGNVLSVAGVYRDTIFRPAMQESSLDPQVVSAKSVRPAVDPKADREHYNLWTQGCHVFDTIRYLAGPIAAVTADVSRQDGQFSWHGLLEFTNGACGHFELTCKACADWCERYEVLGTGGSVEVSVSLPFYHRPAQVRCFDGSNQQYHGTLGAHSNAYANQLDAFATAILDNLPANPDTIEGLAAVRALEAVATSVRERRRVELVQDEV